MNKILLSFDVEEFDIPMEYHAEITVQEQNDISQKGMCAILDILDKYDAKVTFFVTASFAEKNPELIRRMATNHEIASHGMYHSDFKVEHLVKSKCILEHLSGKEVIGFRSARLATVPPREILKAGYVYDSSINPTFLPGRYNNLNIPANVHKESCGIVRFPISVVPFIRFPLFWLSFKNLPLWFYMFLAKISLNKFGFFNLYTHPWEYNEESKFQRWKLPGYIVRHAGKEQCERLSTLLNKLGKKGTFVTFSEYLTEWKK